jgi:4-phospho-D-threonate 3-dehydrogenase / 4-phospho-D-erythronate 3-dehydrogenase
VTESARLPRLAITLGDANGIGPEVTLRALQDDATRRCCEVVVVGDETVVQQALALIGKTSSGDPEIVIDESMRSSFHDVQPGIVDLRAGDAAFRWLSRAIDLALAGDVDGIVTAPLNKYALHQAGHDFPGHTEILAERCGIEQYAMMLYVPAGATVSGPQGLAVAHVTLHTSIASVPRLLTQQRVRQTIELIDGFLRRIGCVRPRVGVCALNPHAGEEGLFGSEEATFIRPAVESAVAVGIDARGPFPADTLMKRAAEGEFDGVAAMYHDQGHIALKLLAFGRAVNVTLGLPMIRTSPSHGTAFDIAWQGLADPAGMIAAIQTGAMLVANRPSSLQRH